MQRYLKKIQFWFRDDWHFHMNATPSQKQYVPPQIVTYSSVFLKCEGKKKNIIRDII